MSSGNQVSDNMQNVALQGFTGLYSQVGDYWSKSWSGNDWDPVTRERVEHYYDMTHSEYSVGLVFGHRDKIFGGTNDDIISWPLNSFTGFALPEDPWSSNDDLKILTALGNKARANDFNGANFIGEIHQPIKMISSLAEDAAALLYGLRKGQFKQAKQLAADIRDFGWKTTEARKKLRNAMNIRSGKQFVRDLKDNLISEEAMAERVLLVQYGIKPLLADMHDGAQAIARVASDKYFDQGLSQWIKVRRTVKVNSVDTSSYNNVLNQKLIRKELIRARLISRPSTLTLLHVNDPLSALWETTAWSFVVDWVIPIGTWLSALDTINSFEWGECWRTRYVIKQVQLGIFNSQTVNSGVTQWPDPFPYYKTVTVRREPFGINSSTYIPPVPTYKSGIVPEHWLNGISLLVGAKTNIAKTLRH